MGEDCRDCIHSKNFNMRLDKVEKVVGAKGDMFEERITQLERRSDVSDQKFFQIFDKLDEIIGILKEREQRLPNLVWQIASVTIASLISGLGVFLWRG